MAHLYYMSLPDVPHWDRAIKDVGIQLRPYHEYLQTAQRAAMDRRPTLSWRAATPWEARLFDERLQRRYADRRRRAAEGQRRRERHASGSPPTGAWVVLSPPPWRPEEAEDTFEAFLDLQAAVHDRVPRPGDQGSRVLEFDREGLAILLPQLPSAIEAPSPEAAPEPGKPRLVGPLLFIKPNTYTIQCQLRALKRLEDRPAPHLGPLLGLAVADARWRTVEPIDIAEGNWIFLSRTERDGTDEQREFVRRAIGTPDFAVLEGPPGSGKTTAICELIAQLALAGKRVMLVASTHVAVDNVLERMLKRQDALPDKLILPVRIGDEGDVASEAVRPWVYQRLLQTWRGEIQDFLDAPRGGSPIGVKARSRLQQALANAQSGGESVVAQLLLESTNLVCGTTIGILRHPAIRAARESPPEPFDVLILDEASKTPFAEFLVPAVHARKWIVVGDARQLSPYVEEQDLAENLRGLLQPEQADAAALAFLASDLSSPRSRCLVAAPTLEMSERLAEEALARGVRFVDLDRHDPTGPVLALLDADLVFGSSGAMENFQYRLPAEVDATGGRLPHLPAWEAARRALTTARFIETKDGPVDWAGEVAWRLVRSYELRQSRDERNRYSRQIDGLLPRALSAEDSERLRRSLDTFRRVAMPSILELLQRGFERLPDKPQFGVALTDGLPPDVLGARHVALSYQHRMHPDISMFPREQFYTAPADTDAARRASYSPMAGDPSSGAGDARAPVLLRDAATMEADRQWSYPRYRSRRAVWLHVPPSRQPRGNQNVAEADRVVKELEEFARWGQGNPNRGREGLVAPWEVAVLTFYRGQEGHLRERLQRLSALPGNTRNFSLPREVPVERRLIHVTLCTVDRFQGHEADLVFLSFVKSGTIGFLNSPSRLNVALTRARYQMLLIGDREFFRSERCRSKLLRALGASHCYPADITWETV